MKGGIDISMLRVMYEVFCESPQEIAEQLGVSRVLVEYAIEENGFVQTKLAKSVKEWRNVELKDTPDDMLVDVRRRLKAIHALKQSALDPKYLTIEVALLTKLQSIVENIDSSEPGAAGRLRDVAATYASLREKSAPAELGQPEQTPGQGGLTINIMGVVGNDYAPAEHAQVKIMTGVNGNMGGGVQALSCESTS